MSTEKRGSTSSQYELPRHHSTGSASYRSLTSPSARNNTRKLSEKDQHRSRFLSDTEKVLVEDPGKTRESLGAIDDNDKKLWHLQPTATIGKILDVNFSTGLASDEAQRRIQQYGKNTLEPEVVTPVYVIFLLQFLNLIVLMLLFASIASIALKEFVEGIAIMFIITLNAVIATYQEKSAANALAALAKMSSPQCVVIRDGKQQEMQSENLVPGDIVLLVTGDVAPADIRLLNSSDLKVNEMLLTGESEDVSKKFDARMETSTKLTADNMVFSSTTVAAGNGTGIVVETGMGTRVGSIANLLKQKTDESESKNPISRWLQKYQPKLTPLQRSLHQLGVLMGIIAITVCIMVFVVGMVRKTIDPLHPERERWLTMIMMSVSLAVSAVPEGLPMVVTICLSSGTAHMIKKQVLVRKLAAVETLGAASVICTDKTGTLTEGKMTALKMWGDFKEYDITGKGFTPEGDILLGEESQIAPGAGNIQVRATLLSCVLCSNTRLNQEEVDGSVRWIPLGNSSEAPLVVAAAKAGIWEDYVMENYPRVAEIPFSSSRKMMITVNETPNGVLDTLELPNKAPLVACVKGAPNYILKNCTKYCATDGTITEMTSAQRKVVLQAVDDLSSQALRVLAVAIRPFDAMPYPKECDDIDEKFAALSKDLVLMGLMASIDPERDGVRNAIDTARNASIRTVMITGDYLKTAVAIAKNIDLLQVGSDPDEAATDCSILRPTNDEYIAEVDFDEITSRTLVFARAKPEDKIEIVKSLQRQGLVAAMTGDGVNDAPALKEADIGVAMGIAGTEVAKGASDMILMDDNFCSIVAAVEKGRVIYANIQKFVTFLLSTNVGEILLIFTAIASGLPMPLQPLQILILNLFSDGMPAVALSLEEGDPNIMNDRPRPKTQKILHGRLWILVIFNAFFIATAAMTVYCLGLYWNFNMFLLNDIIGGTEARKDYKHIECESFDGSNWNILKDPAEDCVKIGLARAQTITFICITTTEVFRAYTVRSFSDPVFVGMFSNKWMQYAAVASILLTVFVTNTPYVMTDLFGFEYIPFFMWAAAFGGAFFSVFCGELLKWYFRSNDRVQARWQSMQDGFDTVLMEIRNVRHHISHLEDKLEITVHRPALRLTSSNKAKVRSE